MDEKTHESCQTLTKVGSIQELSENSWCVVDGQEFQVRVGPDYSSNKQKSASIECILDVLGVDVFRTPRKSDHIMQHLSTPKGIPPIHRDAQADFWCPDYLVLNVMLPAYAPSNPVWGSTKDDGPSYSLVIYYGFSQQVYDGMLTDKSHALTLLRQWLQVDTLHSDDYEMRGRLKGIPVIQNPQDASFGLLSSLVNMYNAKPFLTGPKHHRFVKTDQYLEVDVDIHRYMYLARSTFNSLVSEVPKLKLNFALVVEARDDEELPEQVLGAVQISGVDIKSAKQLDL